MFGVFLEDLEVYCYHGVSPEERAVGHRYVLSLRLEVDGNADATDRVEDTVDYGELGEFVSVLCTSEQYLTLERLGAEICRRVLDRYPSVADIQLKLAKRLPPAPIIAKAAGVQIRMARE